MTTAQAPRNARQGRDRTVADVSALLYLESPEARLLLALFVASTLAFTMGTSDMLLRPWQSYLAMALVSGAAVLLLRSHPDPFPLRDTAAVLAVVVVSTVLVTTNLPDTGDVGRAAWYLGTNTWLLFFLALRRRGLYAWAGMAAMAALTVLWAASSGRGAVSGLLMLNAHIGLLLVATLFAKALRTTASRIASLESRALAAAEEEARIAALEGIRQSRASELARIAVPLLERIAAGGPYSEREREDFAVAEAGLRDSVRGRSLLQPPVPDAVERARRRGVAVTVLDDRGALPLDGEAVGRLIGATVRSLDAARGGSITVRLVPEGRSSALTIVARDDETTARVTLDADGREVQTD